MRERREISCAQYASFVAARCDDASDEATGNCRDRYVQAFAACREEVGGGREVCFDRGYGPLMCAQPTEHAGP